MTKNEFYKQWLEHFAVEFPPKDLKNMLFHRKLNMAHLFSFLSTLTHRLCGSSQQKKSNLSTKTHWTFLNDVCPLSRKVNI